jgi:polyisoprenoid-binding protein YceI
MKRWIIGIVVLAVLVVVVGPFVYFHFIEGKAPPKLSLKTTPIPTTVAGEKRAPLAGTWKSAKDSIARYRVHEVLFGQSNTAVGETNAVTGSMTIAGTRVTDAKFTVDMTTFHSKEGLRDNQFQGRIMNTAQFPTSVFTLTKPIELSPIPNDGVDTSYTATGTLQMHGTTNNVNFTIDARRTGNTIAVHGLEPITFSDYGINNPSGGPASVGNTGQLEFVLQLQPS